MGPKRDGTLKDVQVWGNVRPVWNLVGRRGLGEATRERHLGGLKHDCVGESTSRLNLDLGLKMEAKAGADTWA